MADDIEKYRLPNRMIGVVFRKRWNAYGGGTLAAFAEQQAQQLQAAGIVDFRLPDGKPAERVPAPAAPAPQPATAAETGTHTGTGAETAQAETGDETDEIDLDAVIIPDDWMDLHHAKKMAMARELGVETMTKDQAETVIRLELERRAAASNAA